MVSFFTPQQQQQFLAPALRFKDLIVVLTLSQYITHLISAPSRTMITMVSVRKSVSWRGSKVQETGESVAFSKCWFFFLDLSQTQPWPKLLLSRSLICRLAGLSISGFLSENIYLSEILLKYFISRHWKDRPPPPSNIPILGRSFSTKHDGEPDWMRYLKPPYMLYDPKKVSSMFVNRGHLASMDRFSRFRTRSGWSGISPRHLRLTKLDQMSSFIRDTTSSLIPEASITMKIRLGLSLIKTPGCPSLALAEIEAQASSSAPVIQSHQSHQDCQEDYHRLGWDHRSVLCCRLLSTDIISKFRWGLSASQAQQVTIKEKCEENWGKILQSGTVDNQKD